MRIFRMRTTGIRINLGLKTQGIVNMRFYVAGQQLDGVLAKRLGGQKTSG